MLHRKKLLFDGPLMIGLITLSFLGLVVIYSASGENISVMVRQGIRLGIGWAVMILVAQISPETIKRFSPHFFIVGVVVLISVLLVGVVAKGAQRWLDLGVFRFQPSELMKLALPCLLYTSPSPRD